MSSPMRTPSQRRMALLSLILASTLCPPVLKAQTPTHALSLTEAIAQWEKHSIDLEDARLRIEGARIDEQIAGQRPNPELSVETRQVSAGRDETRADTTVRFEQRIERGNKPALRQNAAQQRYRVATLERMETQRSGRLALETQYYALRLAQETLDITRAVSALYRQSLAAAERRLNEGDMPGADVNRLRVEALRLENTVQEAEMAQAEARLGLGYLLGLPPKEAGVLEASDPWPPLPPNRMETGDTAQLSRRSDLAAAQARLDTARAELELARSERTRDVTLGVLAERQAPASYLGLEVRVPLFIHHRYEAQIARVQLETTQAEAALRRETARAYRELEEARINLEHAIARAQRFERGGLLVAAEKAARNAEFAYTQGASDIMELLDARRTFLNTALEAAQARADLAIAQAGWNAATHFNIPSDAPNLSP
ncbi:MAG: TolC family protein [Pseudomonadota bacterium]